MNEDKMVLSIVELETKLSFQENTIQELNDALMAQQQRILYLDAKIGLLAKKLEVVSPSIIAAESEESPPPHY